MKRTSIIIFFLVTTLFNVVAQDKQDKIAEFRSTVLPQYKIYFTDAGLTENGQLKLASTSGYNSLSVENKTAIMNMLVRTWPNTLIIVENGSTRELWGISEGKSKAVLIDRWNTDGIKEIKAPELPLSKNALHPWFIYFGFQFKIDSQENVSMGLNGRTGFFLLKNRWDLAVTASGFMMGNIESETNTYQSSFGLMSKVYFPVEKLKISPNIGGEVSYTTISVEETKSSSVTPYGIVGISWFVGNGSFDLSVRAGKQSSAMLGYTFFPRPKSAR